MASDEMKMGRNNGNRESPAADDDWERMIDNGSLDRAIEKLSMKNSSKGGVSDAEKDLNEAPKVQVHLEEPPTRTPFTPMVRILKRETKPKSAVNNELGLSNVNGAPAQKTPPTAKTFAQRQDEYARARARIMGSQSTNAPVVPNGNVRTTTLLDSSNNRHQDGQQQQLQQQLQQQFHRERRANGR